MANPRSPKEDKENDEKGEFHETPNEETEPRLFDDDHEELIALTGAHSLDQRIVETELLEGEDLYTDDPEKTIDLFTTNADSDALERVVGEYTDDEDIKDDFGERQTLAREADKLIEELTAANTESPAISAEDIDADWSDIQSGEETVGGSTPTPDQDIVDELGEAVGLVYDDDEELNTEDKIDDRDQNRWELSPDSAVDEDETDESNPIL